MSLRSIDRFQLEFTSDDLWQKLRSDQFIGNAFIHTDRQDLCVRVFRMQFDMFRYFTTEHISFRPLNTSVKSKVFCVDPPHFDVMRISNEPGKESQNTQSV